MLQSANAKVSVVIPTYNRANLLPRAVNSVLAQTYQDYEIIIVDDCSSDNTQAVISNFDDSRIHSLRHERNKGASAARNTGIGYARGEYIAFLDDDDEWLPINLEDQVRLLDLSPHSVGLTYGWMDTVEDSSGRIMPGSRDTISGDVFEDALGLNFPPTPALLVRSSVVREVGGFDERLTIYEDPDFFLRISQRYEVSVLPEVIAKRHVEHGKDRLSDNTPEMLSTSSEILKAYMAGYSSELRHRPQAHSAVLRHFATVEMMRGDRMAAVSAFLTSVKLNPVNPKTLSHLPLLLKLLIWYATPLSHFRSRARAIRDRFRRGSLNHGR